MERFAKTLLVVTAIVGLAAFYVLNSRLPRPEGKQSATLYQPGTLGLSAEPIELVDTSRPTKSNGDFEGSPSRKLSGFIWMPQAQGRRPFPLIVYSHGFMSNVAEAEYLAEFLVPKGYVVVAVDYPLSNGGAPGGPNASDVINQPGDVSFVIDAVLARNADQEDSLHGLLDPSRIAAAGLSLGGLTTELVAFHRDLRDPRVGAAISIAGPSAALEREFFQTTDIPFMMIAGSSDAIVPYHANAAPIPSKVDNSFLVTLDKASHTGFAGISAVLFRWLRHPDEIMCPILLDGLNREGGEGEPVLAPNPSAGISTSKAAACAVERFEHAMRPAQQQMLTRLAVYAFLEFQFADEPERKREVSDYLTTALAAENASVTVESSSGLDLRVE